MPASRRAIWVLGLCLCLSLLFCSKEVRAASECDPAPAIEGVFNCESFSYGKQACVSDTYIGSVASTESGGDYQCKHKVSSALGKYQFLTATRADICKRTSLPCVGPGDFAHCPALQDAYFQELNRLNYAQLKSCGAFDQLGKSIKGVVVTQSGLLAAAHLGGAGGACKWVNTDGAYDKGDGHTSLTSYARRHAGIPMIDGPCPPIGPNYTPPPKATACAAKGNCDGAKKPTGSPTAPPIDTTHPPVDHDIDEINDAYRRCLDFCDNHPPTSTRNSYYRNCSYPPGSNYAAYTGCCVAPWGVNHNPCFIMGDGG
ncbi:MAG: hypothetical protein H6857_00020 [Rhodospirillales bacterium]|nr:hypothetical protein [Rhodospirillales bacterium]